MNGMRTGMVGTTASSGVAAAANAVATLSHGGTGQRMYLTGFIATASGATSAVAVTITVTGCSGGTMSFIYEAPASVTGPCAPLVVEFPVPIPAITDATDIVVTLPSLGSGNDHAAVVAHGFLA